MSTAATLAIKVVSDSRQARGDLDQTGKSVSKWGDRTAKVGSLAGKAFAGGLVVAGAAALKWGQQASDMAETQSKVNVIFGKEGAAALDKFASSAATNLGQSRQAALDAAATFGTFGKVAGLQGKDLAGFSTQLTSLASDMASFSNTSPEQAVEALGAALRGEAEPIRAYGVMLDDATLRAEAMKLGIIKTTKQALTPQQKVLAAQSAILKQTKDAQGDFARTSTGLANQQRILKARMTDLSTEIGAKLLPVMVKVTGVGLEVVDWIDKNQKITGVLVIALGSLLAVTWATSKAIAAWTAITKIASAAQKIWTAVQWAFNAAMSANPIGLIVLAVVALVAAIVIAYKKSDTFRALVQRVGQIGATAIGWVVDKVRVLIRWLSDVLTWVKSKIPGGFSTMKTLAVLYIGLVTAPIRILFSLIQNVFTWVKDKLPGAFEGLKNKITSIGSKLLSPFRTLWNLLQDIWNKIQSILDKAKSLPSPTDSGSAFTGNHSLSDLFRPTVAPAPPPAEPSTTMNLTVQVDGSIIGTTDERVGQELLTAINRGLRVVGREPIGT